MQTQCPHCKSRYRLSPEMVEAYGGFVRCGNCNYKFNVHDQVRLDNDYFELSQENAVQEGFSDERMDFRHASSGIAAAGRSATDRSTMDRIEPSLDAPEEDELNIRFRSDEYEFEEDMPDSPPEKIEPRFEFPSLDDDEDETNSQAVIDQAPDAIDALQSDQQIVDSPKSDFSEIREIEDQAEEDLVEEDLTDEYQSEEHPGRTEEPLRSPFDTPTKDDLDLGGQDSNPGVNTEGVSTQSIAQSEHPSSDSRSNSLDKPDELDDFHFGENFEVEEDDNQRIEPSFSSGSLINDEAEQEPSGAGVFQLVFAMLRRFITFGFWLLAAIALAYLLLGQIKDRVYPAYKQTPLVQDIRDGVCGFLPCVDTKYDVEQYEIVVSRMDEINSAGRQLHISVFLLNKALHAQAYPNLLITLKRIDGTTAGRRIITPEEYTISQNGLISPLGKIGSSVTKAMIKPNKLGKLLIKFDKPPADAVGFEARVVP